MLLSTLSAMQEKAQHLEYNLSAETRIKLDLFSALGDARRQLEIAQGSHSFSEHMFCLPVLLHFKWLCILSVCGACLFLHVSRYLKNWHQIRTLFWEKVVLSFSPKIACTDFCIKRFFTIIFSSKTVFLMIQFNTSSILMAMYEFVFWYHYFSNWLPKSSKCGLFYIN